MDNEKDNKDKKHKGLKIFLFILLGVFILIILGWTAFSLIGRTSAEAVIPDSAVLRLSVSNPVRLLDGILAHESLQEIYDKPELAPAVSLLKSLDESSLLKNRLLRFAARGNIEIAMMPSSEGSNGKFIAVWDIGFFSPLLRILPTLSGFVSVSNLYYVNAGKNSRFEYRMGDRTFFAGPYRNLLVISDGSPVFEARGMAAASGSQVEKIEKPFTVIKPSSYDAIVKISPAYIREIFAKQDESIAAILDNIEFDSDVEAGISVYQKKLEFRLAAPLSSRQQTLKRLIEQRSSAPDFTERLPAAAQYTTLLSAGTLNELYSAALVFSGPSLEDTIKQADSSARFLLGLTLDDLLFSWSGKEFAAFGMEGRPNPVYAIQINDERKRQAVFDKAFKSIVLNENIRLNLDGVRIPRIEVPQFLQSLLKHWDIYLPSPYYTVYKDCLLASESAEALLTALRAMQRNDSLIKTADWREIAGGKNAASAFSLYYSLDREPPFFLRKNTALSSFLGIYRQGLVRMSFDKGVADITISMVPGSGNGVTLVNSVAVETRGRLSNRVYGSGKPGDSRVFLSAGNTVLSINVADNSVKELSGQGQLWILPAGSEAAGASARDAATAWVVSDRGRVLLVNGEMETVQGFPVLTGLRLSAPPVEFEGKLYLCDEDGKVFSVDANGKQDAWKTPFYTALRSPPSFLTIAAKNITKSYAAVYPKSFFGEIWLLDTNGKVLPNWPAPISAAIDGKNEDDEFDSGQSPSSPFGYGGEYFTSQSGDRDAGSSSIAFGSPLLFAHNNRVLTAFVNQAGELLVYDETAALFKPFPVMLDGVFYQQPVFDGEYLWLASAEGTFFRVSIAGEVLSQNIPGFSVKEEGYIATFDCNGDKIPEVFITGEGNALYAFTRNFRSLEGFPLPVWGKPLFIENNGKGKAEVTGIGMDRRLYRWQFK